MLLEVSQVRHTRGGFGVCSAENVWCSAKCADTETARKEGWMSGKGGEQDEEEETVFNLLRVFCTGVNKKVNERELFQCCRRTTEFKYSSFNMSASSPTMSA